MTIPLIGYLDRFSSRPGGRIEVKVSSQLDGPYAADLVRVRHGDPNPAGPGMKLIELPSSFAGSYPSRVQPTHLGSWVDVPAVALDLGDAFTLRVRVQPRVLDAAPRTVIARLGADGAGWALRMTETGAVFTIGAVTCAVDAPPALRRWYEIAVTVGGGAVSVEQRALQTTWGVSDSGSARATGAIGPLPRASVSIAAEGAPAGRHFEGRIEDPMLLRGARAGGEIADSDPDLLAWWDFSIGIDTQAVADRGPLKLSGKAINLPMRAVTGSRWTGREMCWRHAPREYAAIHFHSDDLGDSGWQTDFAVDIPSDMRSGAYGVRLRGGGHEDIIPFYVLPPKGRATAPIAFLASTFTYQAYANHARGNWEPAFDQRMQDWGGYRHSPDRHHDYSHCTYNHHPDGTGLAFSSRLRPIMTMRPGFLTIFDQRGSGLRHYAADTHILDWLEEKGFAFDVLTDEDLDDEGVELLRSYRCVLTTSHPEYHTTGTLDALQSYVSDGGRLCYLGGNGFYWRIARRKDMPWAIEIRRAEGGIRAWAAEPGEYFNAFDGNYGGLWRRNGRPPQKLAGVGFSGQGLFEGSYFRRLPQADAPEVAWIMEGITDELLGDFGLSGGGAAGYELDRADLRLGSPPNVRILARSEKHQDHFVTVPEELLTHVATETGEKPAALIRAEIVHFETQKGGAVFSTGSITFCGSLSHANYRNNISRMVENVVRRFSGNQ